MTNTFRLHVTGRDGKVRESDARIDVSLLTILRDAGIDEISAMCGGNCSCATCHVYVDVGPSLPGPAIEESEMLDTLVHQTSLSRLACQVALSAGISALRVEVAPEE
ncbi:MAG: 2Fe-2S iron-sulfur cluster binding domain-containing protein [Rhizobium sp.]|nr:2Fe-2S iron-sulfur cluster binding domain-containing protein [Rhizobium sp.]